MPAKRLYKIVFFNQGQIYEIYAKSVGQGNLWGFVEVEELTFGTRTQVVVDPSEERLQSEFAGVKRTYIPIQAVIRIDEVEKQGVAKITDSKGNVTPFPMPVYGPNSPKRD